MNETININKNLADSLLYTKFYQELLERNINSIVHEFQFFVKKHKELLNKIRDTIKVHTANGESKEAYKRVVGVDAGRNGRDYKFAYIPIYSGVAVLIENWQIVEEPLFKFGSAEVWLTEREPTRRENLLHVSLEYKLAKDSIKKWNPDYLFFDGGLVLNPKLLPIPRDTTDYKEDFLYTILNALELFELCKENRTTIIGFIKRTRMCHYCRELDIRPVRDVSLLNSILREGEYTTPFPIRNKVSNIYKQVAHKSGFSHVDVYTFYIKTCKSTYRAEVLDFSTDDVDKIASLIYTLSKTDLNGIPYPIYEADKLTKISSKTSNLHSLALYSKALDLIKSGQISQEDVNLLLPQYGEEFSLENHSEVL